MSGPADVHYSSDDEPGIARRGRARFRYVRPSGREVTDEVDNKGWVPNGSLSMAR